MKGKIKLLLYLSFNVFILEKSSSKREAQFKISNLSSFSKVFILFFISLLNSFSTCFFI
ncbi:MAG: hypothetical protein P1U46_02785 [Patescibacteria group bacterium]|nr:hypothetical protein [Patescibacteria group bacterium]